MPRIRQEAPGSDFAQGMLGLGEGIMAGMQLKQAMEIERARAQILRESLDEEKRARLAAEERAARLDEFARSQFTQQQGLAERRVRLEEREAESAESARTSQADVANEMFDSFARTMRESGLDDIAAEAEAYIGRVTDPTLGVQLLEQLGNEAEMRLGPAAVDETLQEIRGLAESGVIDEAEIQGYEARMQRWLQSGGKDGSDPDDVSAELSKLRLEAGDRLSARAHAEKTAAMFEPLIDQVMPAGSEQAAIARSVLEQIRLSQDASEISKLSGDLRRMISGERDEEWALELATEAARGQYFLTNEERIGFVREMADFLLRQRRGEGPAAPTAEAKQEAPADQGMSYRDFQRRSGRKEAVSPGAAVSPESLEESHRKLRELLELPEADREDTAKKGKKKTSYQPRERR